jgi:hypothetical protein
MQKVKDAVPCILSELVHSAKWAANSQLATETVEGLSLTAKKKEKKSWP